MWIAFIFQYLWDTKQHLKGSKLLNNGCELLSFFSIFGIQNNKRKNGSGAELVVNCFHFSVSLGYKTTTLATIIPAVMLWIAFIFQYLWDTKQRRYDKRHQKSSCELLSFFSIFGIQNNEESGIDAERAVVNCFHFSVSLGYKTTTKQEFKN